MKTIIQNWALVFVIAIINAKLFDFKDWQFYVVPFLAGVYIKDLFIKKNKTND